MLAENSKRVFRRKSLAEAWKNLSLSLSTGSGHLTRIISLWLLGNIIRGGTLLCYKKHAFNRRRHRAFFLYHHLVIGGSGCGERIDHCLIITFLFYSCLPDWNFSLIRAQQSRVQWPGAAALSIVFIIDKVCCVLPAVPKVRVELLPSWAATPRHAETNTHSRIAFHTAFLSRALTFSAAEQAAWYMVLKEECLEEVGNFAFYTPWIQKQKCSSDPSIHWQNKCLAPNLNGTRILKKASCYLY